MRSLLGLVALGVTLAGCASSGGPCREPPLEDAVREQLREAEASVDFELLVPCAAGGMRVSTVAVDRPAGSPRVTLVAEDGRARIMLSQSREVAPFRQVPDGTRRLDWDVDGVAAAGFEGTSPSGSPLLYLRWEVDDVIYEWQSTSHGPLTAADARDAARTTIRRSAAAGGDGETDD